jgi:dienelactone hydrolase
VPDATGGEAPWRQRFRAARVSLPTWARDRPERLLYLSNASGVVELHLWDRAAGTHRQLTDRPHGTATGALDPAGATVWWFDDEGGNERGHWRRVAFDGPAGDSPRPGPVRGEEPGPSAGGEEADPTAGGQHRAPGEIVPDVPEGYPAGTAIGHRVAVVGVASERGHEVWTVLRPDAPGGAGSTGAGGAGGETGTDLDRPGPHGGEGGGAHLVHVHPEPVEVGPLNRSETLVALAHAEHGDARNPALRVVTPTGQTVADLWDGPGRGLRPVEWAPAAGDDRLLVMHDRGELSRPLVWDLRTGSVDEVRVALAGEIVVDWWPDGAGLLVVHDHQARGDLYHLDLATGGLERLPSPPGSIGQAAVRPDGDVWYLWSDASSPSEVRSSATGGPVLTAAGPAAPRGRPASDRFVPTPHGTVHALVFEPDGPAHGTIFDIHGGPEWHDSDAFEPRVQAWLDHGYAVVQVNYRGSTGYGRAWRDAIVGNPGLTELADIAAVRDALVTEGRVDPGRVVLSGRSWGGYLTLLGLGTQPDRWSHGVAVVPVADYLAAYEDEMEPLRAYDRALFGGSPTERPDTYRERSPITYVDRVTQPLLVIAGVNDPRCPIRQIERYLDAAEAAGHPAEVHRYDAGHGALVVDEAVRQVEVVLDFLHRHLGGPPPA